MNRVLAHAPLAILSLICMILELIFNIMHAYVLFYSSYKKIYDKHNLLITECRDFIIMYLIPIYLFDKFFYILIHAIIENSAHRLFLLKYI